MIQLYYYPGNASLAVHIVLEELGVPFSLELVDRANAAHKSPEYLKLNPNGLIPVLVDGDLVCTRRSPSACISPTRTRARLAPPLGTHERAHFYKWFVWCSNTLQAMLMHYFTASEWSTKGDKRRRPGESARLRPHRGRCSISSTRTREPWAGLLLGASYTAVDPFAMLMGRGRAGSRVRRAACRILGRTAARAGAPAVHARSRPRSWRRRLSSVRRVRDLQCVDARGAMRDQNNNREGCVMRLLQLKDDAGPRPCRPRRRRQDHARSFRGYEGVLELARDAIRRGVRLDDLARVSKVDLRLDYDAVERAGQCAVRSIIRIRAPHRFGDRAYAPQERQRARRDASWRRAGAARAGDSDSMRMYRMGVESGKPAAGRPGVAPEWFYKGDGSIIVPPGAPLTMPSFAMTGARRRRSLVSTSSTTKACLGGSGFRASATSSRTTSSKGRIICTPALRSCANARWGRRSCWAIFPIRCRGLRGCCAPAKRCGKGDFQSGEGPHGSFHREPRAPPLQAPACSAGPGSSIATSSAPPR
jgi:glutathione S-transferase